MVLLHCNDRQIPNFAPGMPEFEQMMSGWMAFNQMLVDGGHFIEAAALVPTATATTIVKNLDATVTDGPFAETKEQLDGIV
jgi:hypothetical protein